MFYKFVNSRLLRGKPDGTFLVRESTNFPGDFTLCMSFHGKVEHYRIEQTSGGQLTCDKEEYFSNLTQLVSVSHFGAVETGKGGGMGNEPVFVRMRQVKITVMILYCEELYYKKGW